MKIGKRDSAESVIVIAEIGNNHEGDFDLAKEMVIKAAAAGADVVKFQTIIPDRLVSAQDEKRIEQLSRFQLSRQQFSELAECASNCGVEFMSTPFDLHSVDWLDELVPAYKIASGDNDFYPLLDRVAQTGKPVLISMGLGNHQHAQQLHKHFIGAWSRIGVEVGEIGMLHCVVSYPTPDNQAGLQNIRKLSLPDVTPGYSDHTIGIKAAELAVAAGARVIEKHFTIDNDFSSFRDHALSADPSDFEDMVKAIRMAEGFLGNSDSVDQECEKANREAVRRSLAAGVDLEVGAELSMSDLIWVRPGTGIRPGEEGRVIGRRIKIPIAAGEQILEKQLV